MEYIVHTLRHTEQTSAVLNKFGRDGWELVSVVPYPDTHSVYSVTLYMKRAVPTSTQVRWRYGTLDDGDGTDLG